MADLQWLTSGLAFPEVAYPRAFWAVLHGLGAALLACPGTSQVGRSLCVRTLWFRAAPCPAKRSCQTLPWVPYRVLHGWSIPCRGRVQRGVGPGWPCLC